MQPSFHLQQRAEDFKAIGLICRLNISDIWAPEISWLATGLMFSEDISPVLNPLVGLPELFILC